MATRGMRGRMWFGALLIGVSLIAIGRPAYAGFLKLNAPCDGVARILAITNGTPAAMDAMQIKGDCNVLFYCDNGAGGAVGGQVLLNPLGILGTMACPAGAVSLSIVPGVVAGGAVTVFVSRP